jgi:hypothetical protein
LLSEITGSVGIGILGRLYSVVTDNTTNYSVRISTDLIMIEVFKIMTTAHAFERTGNQRIVSTVKEAHEKLIADVPLFFADERYKWFTWQQKFKDPETGETLWKVNGGYSYDGVNYYGDNYGDVFSKYTAIVLATFRENKGKYLIDILPLIDNLNNNL